MISKKLGTCILAAVAAAVIAAPLFPLSEVKAAEPVNLALNKTATASESESGTQYTADKAFDGNADYEAEKAQQSRWATNQLDGERDAWLQVDLDGTHSVQSFVIAWERTNITSYSIQVATAEAPTDGDWETVYTKKGDGDISKEIENIHLPEAEDARFVRLYVDGYNGGESGWKSVSVYEFQVYEDAIPDDLLPEENYCLEGTAEASNFEETDNNPGSQNAAKAIDGDKSTRWATANSQNGAADRWITITLPASQRVQYFKIFWEKTNIIKYEISVDPSGDGSFQSVYTNEKQIDNTQQLISLETPVWAKQIKLNVTEYGQSANNWWNVSVAEFEAYAKEPGAISEDATAKEVADLLEAPTINEDGTALVFPSVPEGFTVEFLADYEQVVGKDGKIYKPLTTKTVKGIYKVTKGEDSAEGSTEHTLEIPGQYDDAGTNAKPTVVPELAEWHGGDGDYTITKNASVYAPEAFSGAAKAFVEDYNAEMGANLTMASSEGSADIVFVSVTDKGLGEEGYIMEIGDKVTVSAEHNTGAYWATRSILQIAELNDGTMPKGITKDYPKYEVRGFMLDVARKPISMETLEDVAKEMAYYKMNEFHVHLNDNLIFYEDYDSAEDAREKAYTGFRLESDIKEGGENQADLTNTDLYYTKEEFRDFILDCRNMGVKITPEFDTPGHSGAFTKVRPDLMLQDIVSGTAERAGEQFDLSEAKYEESLAFVKSLWNEYLTDDMFDKSMTIHIGTDEYYGEKNRFRIFSDNMIEYIQSKGYTVRLWGSLSSMPGDAEVRSEDVQMNVWNTGWANPTKMYEAGFELINTIDGKLYIVPAAGYYFDYLNTQNLYSSWTPNNFDGTVIPAGSEQMLGSTYAIWNDSIDTRANGISEIDIYDRFADAVPTLASKNWGDPSMSYADMEAAVEELGNAANSNPYHEASADADGEYMSYKFEDQTDSSDNGRDLKAVKNAEIKDGSLTLKGDESYAETPIDKLATGNTLEFDITLNEPASTGDILFESDHEGSDDYVHDIRIMDDGRLGFRRELYDYYFDYKLPVGKEVHLSISTNGTTTTLTVNGKTYDAVGVYRNRQTDGEVRKGNIARASLLLPVQRIGSETNAIAATIDNVTVKQGAAVDYHKENWKKVSVDSETSMDSATEGLFEYAFDGKSNTIWHSNWKGASDKVESADGTEGTKDQISGVIDLGQAYTINQFSFTPRTGTNSGQVTKADLYVRTNGTDWTPVAEDKTFAADSTTKTFTFDEQKVRYIRFVAKQSNDGWVAVSEFDIANVPAQTYKVYVEAGEGGTAEKTQDGLAPNTEATVTAEADKGYTFEGWYDAVTGLKLADTAEYTFNVAYNEALNARFTKNGGTETTYTVTFDGENAQTVAEGEKAVKPQTDPVKAGHKFLGWYPEGQDTAFDFNTPITGDIKLVSKFEPYKVEIIPIEGVEFTIGAMEANGQITIKAPKREGYNFQGWKLTGSAGIVSDNPYTFVPTADTQIEAVYEKINDETVYHTVTIIPVEGKSTEIQVEDGKTVPAQTDPVREGYKFLGWYLGNAKYDFSTPVTSDLTIEAHWEKITTPENPGDTDGTGDKGSGSGSTNADKPDGADSGKDKAAQTGDTANPGAWAAAMAVSAVCVLAVVVNKKRIKK